MLEKIEGDGAVAAVVEGGAVEWIDGDHAGGLVLLCDHASNRLPPDYGDLGLAADELRRHIAYDIGAAAVTRGLAARLGAPAVLTRFSRLLIDPNRGTDDPTLIMRLSDGAVVPGNRSVGGAERRRRIERYYLPYHDAIRTTIARARTAGRVPAIVSIHSFTPAWKGVPRPWQVGILWDTDPRLARPLIEALAADAALTVGDNEPYSGALRNDTLYQHATVSGLPNALIELRQDLICDAPGVAGWVDRLSPILARLIADPDIHSAKAHPSRTDR